MLQPVVRGPGMNLGMPDPCATPPLGVVIPYANLALHIQLQLTSLGVKMGGLSAANLGSFSPMSMGMEAGAMHPLLKGLMKLTMGCPIVFVDGLPEAIQTALGISNFGNCALSLALVPAGVNVFVCLEDEAGRASRGDEATSAAAERLAQALEREPIEYEISGEVGRVRIHVLSEAAPPMLHRALRALRSGGVERLELDLRGCPGGELLAAVHVASAFLSTGTLIATVVDADGDATNHHAPFDGDTITPLTVLVDADTASAAEVVAAALQDAGRATIAGAPTFGKATLARLTASSGGPANVRLSGICHRPAGGSLADGVTPEGC